MQYLWLAVGAFLLIAFAVGAYWGERAMRQRWTGPEDIGGDSLIWSLGLAAASMLVIVGIGFFYQLDWYVVLVTIWLLPAASFVVFHTAEYCWGADGENDRMSFRMIAEMIGITLLWPIILALGLWRGPIWLTQMIWHRPRRRTH